MQEDIRNMLSKYSMEEINLLNKSELARRYNCDLRTIDRYLKIESGKLS